MSRRTLILLRTAFMCACLTPGVLTILGTEYSLTNPVTGTKFMVIAEKSDDTKTLAEARATCRTMTIYADVAEITDDSDRDTVLQLMSDSSAESGTHWLGMYGVMPGPIFHSLRTGLPITYDVWKKDSPIDDDSKLCAAWELDKEWLNILCNGGTFRGILCRVLDPIPPSGIDPLTNCPLTAVPHNGNCYNFRIAGAAADRLGFSLARHECDVLEHGNLVVPYSASDANFLQLRAKLSGLSEVWLGISDEIQDEVYDSIYGGATPYFNWGQNEPPTDQGNVACVVLLADTGTYVTRDCTTPQGIVCQVSECVNTSDRYQVAAGTVQRPQASDLRVQETLLISVGVDFDRHADKAGFLF